MFFFVKRMSTNISWLSKIVPSDYVTVKDIKGLRFGEKRLFLCIHRNILDMMECNPPNDPIAHNLFMEYTHVSNLSGYAAFYTHKEGLRNDRGIPFKFHIGIPSNEPMTYYFIPLTFGEEEIPSHNLVGWRGPLVLWNNIVSKCFDYDL